MRDWVRWEQVGGLGKSIAGGGEGVRCFGHDPYHLHAIGGFNMQALSHVQPHLSDLQGRLRLKLSVCGCGAGVDGLVCGCGRGGGDAIYYIYI